MLEAAVAAGGAEEGVVERVPGQGHDFFLVAFEEEDVAHHAEVEDAGGGVASAGCEEGAADGVEEGFGDGVLMAVQVG